MAFKVTISILSESQEGDIGDDWRFELNVKVFNEGLTDEGNIKVKKHTLTAGSVQDPPGPPAPLTLKAGDAEEHILIRFKLKATEVDLFQNDTGIIESDLTCPVRAWKTGFPVTRPTCPWACANLPDFSTRSPYSPLNFAW